MTTTETTQTVTPAELAALIEIAETGCAMWAPGFASDETCADLRDRDAWCPACIAAAALDYTW